MNSSDIFVKVHSDVSYYSRRNIWKHLKAECENIHPFTESKIAINTVDKLLTIIHPIVTEIHKTNQKYEF